MLSIPCVREYECGHSSVRVSAWIGGSISGSWIDELLLFLYLFFNFVACRLLIFFILSCKPFRLHYRLNETTIYLYVSWIVCDLI